MKIMLNNETVEIGSTPYALQICGFKNRYEVIAAAQKHGTQVHTMRLGDVIEYFKSKDGAVNN